MNSKQAKAITRLVQHNFIVSLHQITNDCVFLSFACIDDKFIPAIKAHCYPLRTEFIYDGNKLSCFIYKN